MKKIFLVCFLLLNFCDAQAQAITPLHIFVLAGQSNMSGAASVPEYQEISSNIKVWNNGQWITAIEPVQSSGYLGPSLAFALALSHLNSADYQIGLIPCAVAGTHITDWQQGQTAYQDCVTKTNLALASQQTTLSGVLFAQGEADTYTQELADGWAALALDFARDFRADSGKLEVPFIYAQLGKDPQDTQHPYWSYLQALQPTLLSPTRAYIRMVKTNDLSTIAQHFDTAGYRALGARFAAMYYVNFGQ